MLPAYVALLAPRTQATPTGKRLTTKVEQGYSSSPARSRITLAMSQQRPVMPAVHIQISMEVSSLRLPRTARRTSSPTVQTSNCNFGGHWFAPVPTIRPRRSCTRCVARICLRLHLASLAGQSWFGVRPSGLSGRRKQHQLQQAAKRPEQAGVLYVYACVAEGHNHERGRCGRYVAEQVVLGHRRVPICFDEILAHPNKFLYRTDRLTVNRNSEP